MWDKNSEFQDIRSVKLFEPKHENEFVTLFNQQKFRPKVEFIYTRWYYPSDNFLRHIPVKENIKKDGDKKTCQLTRFRNGVAKGWLNSVDKQEIVKTSGLI
jgi:hypothetical protein